MAFRKHLSIGNISSILGIVSFIIAAITLSKEHLHLVTSTILFPFTEKLNPGIEGSRFIHWLVITLALIIYILFFTGMMKLLMKRGKQQHPHIICQEEIAVMLDSIDASSELDINEKILKFMNTFDKEVANIFQLDPDVLKSLWVFQLKSEEYALYFDNDPAYTVEEDEKSYLMIVDLDEKSEPSEEEKRIIQWALRQPNPQFWDDRIKENFKGKHREFVFVRNYGDFRLGYAILFKEEGKITKQKLEHFESASSYLMLLGKIDNLTTKMIQYLLEKVV